MRNEALVGYLLHQRSYQEKRALYYLFSEQHGVIHGIGKKGAPLFEPLQLFATGKRDLKTFSQINVVPLELDSESAELPQSYEPQRYQQIRGQQQYAALYLNEILWKLLPTEDPMPVLWQHYQDSLLQLKQPLTALELRLCLRQFEQHLFEQLGFAISLAHDSSLVDIDAGCTYRFLPDVGLVSIVSADDIVNATVQTVFKGSELVAMARLGITEVTLGAWSRLYRHLIDHLLDYQPLQSRLLWQQQQRYQS
ncbi:DNA repair protein RecO [Psychrobacter urativorans]|uniref:DNA repair protein RecO n=1 Tax=Psychrobacter urativorans TaxID=45610 RepID=UPI001918C1B2|nr:DNA repair protein RecO C-terminal domain-containing protein [Psychrobacter urativorans]